MLKALLKKQLLELSKFYFQNRKTGKNRSRAGTVGFVLMFVLVFAGVGVMFFGYATVLSPLIEVGQAPLYFAVMGMMALMLGVLGSVFNTYTALFRAKDNELLLAMPIPPKYILLARLLGVYLTGLQFVALAMVPAVLVYWLTVPGFSLPVLLLQIVLIPILALPALTLTCALGWLVALIAVHLRNRSGITTIIYLVFFALYYAFCFRVNAVLRDLVMQSAHIDAVMRSWVYPAYALGAGAAGQVRHALIFAAIAAALFALGCFAMSRSFLHIVTTERGNKKAVYTERRVRAVGLNAALLRRELRRFTASAAYMLNCGIGLVMLLIASFFALIRLESVRAGLDGLMLQLSGGEGFLPVGALALLALVGGMTNITAPSVSLEGKSLSLIQSLPVPPWAALRAKLLLQLAVAAAPTLFATLTLSVVIRSGAAETGLLLLLSLLLMLLSAALGLALNLKYPNLTWTNEAIPIKQGAPVALCVFGFWGLAVVMGGGYYLLTDCIAAPTYLLLWSALVLLADALLLLWLKTRGSVIFAEL